MRFEGSHYGTIYLIAQWNSLSYKEHVEKLMPLADNLFESQGKMLCHQDLLQQNMNIRINPLAYMGWCRAIPGEWKRRLIGSQRNITGEIDEPLTHAGPGGRGV